MLSKTMYNVLFTLDSLAPSMIAYAFLSDAKYRFVFAGIAVLTTAFSLFLLKRWIPKNLPAYPVEVAETKAGDEHSLSYLIAYLWPFLTGKITFTQNAILFLTVVVIFAVCFYQTAAFSFNPVLTLFGYHFYEVKTKERMKTILISKRIFTLERNRLNVRELSNLVWLDADEVKK